MEQAFKPLKNYIYKENEATFKSLMLAANVNSNNPSHKEILKIKKI